MFSWVSKKAGSKKEKDNGCFLKFQFAQIGRMRRDKKNLKLHTNYEVILCIKAFVVVNDDVLSNFKNFVCLI